MCDDKGYDDDSRVKCAEEVNLDSNIGDFNVDHLNVNEVMKMTFSRVDEAELFTIYMQEPLDSISANQIKYMIKMVK